MAAPAPDALGELIERFRANRDSYQSSTYNEAQARIEFIDPLFELLGWDVANRFGYAEAYKEVIHEARVLVAGRSKAPDYAFRVGGVRKFFLEAKKPSVHIGSDQAAAMQLRRYAWSAKLPASVLTNFAELSIYDTRIRPKRGDSALKARLKHFKFEEYFDRWDEIQALCSKDAILKGEFDRQIGSPDSTRDRISVDDAFLAEIERWRVILATNIAANNKDLSSLSLQAAVQLIIDRIIFLRISEDRGIEPQRQLLSAAAKVNAYPQIVKLFRAADVRYNSGLFNITGESSQHVPDELTPTLKVSDTVIRSIINHLYYPESSYEFSAMSADILGQVYERFLGKVIELKGRSATVEYKPEVKKAGGVYYTPTYIVAYIVQRTLGERLLAASIQQRGKAHGMKPVLTVIDPACGSGSFLIEAYQCLLDWYLTTYVANPDTYSKGASATIVPAADGSWKLAFSERRRILVSHIYGVDIDAQAVEVARLSLLLKLLEGQDEAALDSSAAKGRHVLPDLNDNIRCGNSIIDSTYFEVYPEDLDDPDVLRAINPFDWNDEFPEIMNSGGFDVVMGNPPYFSIDKTWGVGDRRLAAVKAIFPDVHTDKTDIYYYFIAKAAQIAKGDVGFIVSRAFLEAVKASKLRGVLSASNSVAGVVDFMNFRVFPKVGITTAMLFLRTSPACNDIEVAKVTEPLQPYEMTVAHLGQDPSIQRFPIPRTSLSIEAWHLNPPGKAPLFGKIDAAGEKLSDFMVLGQGMQTGQNKVFGSKTQAEWKQLGATKSLLKRRARNTDIEPFGIRSRDEFTLYLEEVKSFSNLPVGLQAYLKTNRKLLEARAAFKRGNCDWWRYSWPLNRERYNHSRILCPYLAKDNRFVVDETFVNLGLTDTTVVFENQQPESMKYVCAVLNSKALTYRFRGIGKLKSGGIYEYFDNSVGKLPVRRIRFDKKEDVAAHDGLVEVYDQIEVLKRAKSKLSTLEQRQLSMLRSRSDKLVYDLYGLSEAERAEIEATLGIVK